MPYEVYSSLTPKGREICLGLQAAEGVVVESGALEVGLGAMHTEEGFKNTADDPDRLKLARL